MASRQALKALTGETITRVWQGTRACVFHQSTIKLSGTAIGLFKKEFHIIKTYMVQIGTFWKMNTAWFDGLDVYGYTFWSHPSIKSFQ